MNASSSLSGARRPLRVCFTALNAYPLFDASVQECVGGTETRAWTLARGLSLEPDFEVHFVVQAPRSFRRRTVGAIDVWNVGDGWDGVRRDFSRHVEVHRSFPWLHLRRWHAPVLWQAPLLGLVRLLRYARRDRLQPDARYGRIGADVHCAFGVSGQSARVIASAHASSRPAVLFLASNSDVDDRYRAGSTYVSANGERADVCHAALQSATLIVAQHAHQQSLLQERFQRDAAVLPGVIDLAEWDRRAAERSPLLERLGLTRYVLWVGRADDFHKRPRLCLELARTLKDIPFLMVLNPCDARVERDVRIGKPANVTMIDGVAFGEMPAVLARAAVYVSTGSSEYEGAPNLFLQAAAARVPIASLEVSLPLLDQGGAGFVAGGDMDRLTGCVREAWLEPTRARAQGERGRSFVERYHQAGSVVAELARLLRSVAG